MCIRDSLAGIPQQPRVVLHTFGREGALPGNGAARGAGSELPQAAGAVSYTHLLRITLALVERLAFPFERGDTFFQFRLVQQLSLIHI